MTRKERAARLEKQIAENFKNHEASYRKYASPSSSWPIEALDWRDKSGSGINFVRYLMLQGVLYISGDLGESVHQWGWSREDQFSMRYAAGCDLYYFMSKLCSSSEGERGRIWSEAEALDDIIDMLKDYVGDEIEMEGTTDEAVRKAALELYQKRCDEFGKPWMDSKFEFDRWLFDHATDWFGDYAWECLGNLGMIVAPRHQMQLTGLKMAMASVK